MRADGATYKILGASRPVLQFFADDEIFPMQCGDRALRTVDSVLAECGIDCCRDRIADMRIGQLRIGLLQLVR